MKKELKLCVNCDRYKLIGIDFENGHCSRKQRPVISPVTGIP